MREHYAELSDKPFFADLLSYVGSGPVVCMAWRGREAVKGGLISESIFFFVQSSKKCLNNLFVTSKKRNHEFSNSPIHEFKVLQNVF